MIRSADRKTADVETVNPLMALGDEAATRISRITGKQGKKQDGVAGTADKVNKATAEAIVQDLSETKSFETRNPLMSLGLEARVSMGVRGTSVGGDNHRNDELPHELNGIEMPVVTQNRPASKDVREPDAEIKEECESSSSWIKRMTHRSSNSRSSIGKRCSVWCRAEGCIGVLAVIAEAIIIVYLVVLLVFHCTPLMDWLTNTIGAREYCLVTPVVIVATGITCSILLVLHFRTLALITCRHSHVNETGARLVWHRNSRFGIIRAYQWLYAWVLDPTAPYFELLEFGREVVEVCLGILAVKSFSENAVSQSALALYVLAVFINGLNSLWFAISVTFNWPGAGQRGCCRVRRARRENAVESASRMRLIILVDVIVDVFYGCFPVTTGLKTYYDTYFSQDGKFLCKHLGMPLRGDGCRQAKAYSIQAMSTLALFGGRNSYEIALKVLTRLVPYYFASQRIVALVQLQPSAKMKQKHNRLRARVSNQPFARAPPRLGHSGPSSSPSFPQSASPRRIHGRSHFSNKQGEGAPNPRSFLAKGSHIVKGLLPSKSAESARNEKSRAVPAWAVFLVATVSSSFCVFAWIRLWSLSNSCSEPSRLNWKDNCLRASFPIFDPALPLVLLDPAEVSAGHNHTERVIVCPCTTYGTSAIGGGACSSPRFIEQLRRAIFGHNAAGAPYFMGAIFYGCALNNTHVVEILTNSRNLAGLAIDVPTAIAAPLDISRAGEEQRKIGGDHLVNLQTLYLRHAELGGLPDWFGNLPSLRTLNLDGNRLGQVPKAVNQLTNMRSLSLAANGIALLPRWFCVLTSLHKLNLGRNSISRLPSEFGQLTSLDYLSVAENGLEALPIELERLKKMLWLNFGGNRLAAIPGLPDQKENGLVLHTWPHLLILDVEGNNITLPNLPPSWARAVRSNSSSFAASTLESKLLSNKTATLKKLRANRVTLIRLGNGDWVGNKRVVIETSTPPSNGAGEQRLVISTFSSCSPGCTDYEEAESYVADGVCNAGRNHAACDYDGKDCALVPR